MDDERVFLGDKPLIAYEATQVRDILAEAHRLDVLSGIGDVLVGICARKLDSLKVIGRMDG